MNKRMLLEFKELNQIGLCPVGWPLGKVQLLGPCTLSANNLKRIEELSAQQLKWAAQIKARIEKLEARLMRLLQSEASVGKLKTKTKNSKANSRTARRKS